GSTRAKRRPPRYGNSGYLCVLPPGSPPIPPAPKWFAVFVAPAAFAGLAQAQEPPQRKEMKRADLSGTKMEVILSTAEYKPGDLIARHIHHGEEAFYVLEGATVEAPDGKQTELKTGSGS